MSALTLDLPTREDAVRALRAGDEVLLRGTLHTGRDRFHKFLADGGRSPVDLRGGALFHCGPVVVRDRASPDAPWRAVAAGPTTSSREEPYMAGIVEREGLRAIVGKGGMGKATAQACARFGCVYLQAAGGAAALLAGCVKRVAGVRLMEEFGSAEAVWSFEVEDFPALVAIDATGHSVFDSVREKSAARLAELLGKEPSP